ncbi:hypothetical protein LINPERPRIM_LOCUS5371 [Linum perenne]
MLTILHQPRDLL